MSSCGALFPDRNLEALSRLLECVGATTDVDAHIVLSSTWRVDQSMRRDILASFRSFGNAFGGPLQKISEFYGITDPDNHTNRQQEIFDWIQRHDSVAAWVALDDEELLQGYSNAKNRSFFEGHVVQTESHVGLTLEGVDLAVHLLWSQLAAAEEEGNGKNGACVYSSAQIYRRSA
jgi:hypothetical protein